ncbi:hypothetical protein AVEN_56906-1 [Araneus ventricosus]|uniref:Uncharacterized protein n=1 Tax=Araneus ventricosus TaxID=182803 RepID=A0A4Y2ERD3_ARAVE|nr:hypothetical protein AVEN_56906-1 [Araneus ventricosus]
MFPALLHLLFITKRALHQPATSAAPAKNPSTFNKTVSSTADSIPPHHFHLGEDNYAVVSDFGDAINDDDIGKFRKNENGRFLPTKNGVSFSPFVLETLSNDMHRFPLPSYLDEVIIIRNTLFLAIQGEKMFPVSPFCDMSRNKTSYTTICSICVSTH